MTFSGQIAPKPRSERGDGGAYNGDNRQVISMVSEGTSVTGRASQRSRRWPASFLDEVPPTGGARGAAGAVGEAPGEAGPFRGSALRPQGTGSSGAERPRKPAPCLEEGYPILLLVLLRWQQRGQPTQEGLPGWPLGASCGLPVGWAPVRVSGTATITSGHPGSFCGLQVGWVPDPVSGTAAYTAR